MREPLKLEVACVSAGEDHRPAHSCVNVRDSFPGRDTFRSLVIGLSWTNRRSGDSQSETLPRVADVSVVRLAEGLHRDERSYLGNGALGGQSRSGGGEQNFAACGLGEGSGCQHERADFWAITVVKATVDRDGESNTGMGRYMPRSFLIPLSARCIPGSGARQKTRSFHESRPTGSVPRHRGARATRRAQGDLATFQLC